jgi:hypothetical protein
MRQPERQTGATFAMLASRLFFVAVAVFGAEYRPAATGATLDSFVLTVDGPRVSFVGQKRGGGSFAVHWVRGSRYLLQEGGGPVREFRHPVTGAAVLPSIGGWEAVMPTAEAETLTVLGHGYRRVGSRNVELPVATETVFLQPDLLVGQAHNTRQVDETRRYDTSDYKYVRLTEADYRLMAEAGISCVNVDGEQAAWADRLGLFYWGTASLPYPEMLYRPQYLGPALFLDEPAVGTRDHVLRPRMAKDPALRRSITPAYAMEAFREHFAESMQRAGSTLMRALRALKDVDPGSLDFPQANLYSWETMEATAAYELSQNPVVPAAFVWEPAGRVGTHRTVPELNMNYGTRFPLSPHVLPAIINGFLRGAARATGKEWGISIYGAVERSDAPYWLTRAYDDGATRFFFWDSYQLACVPFGEVLAHARHLRAHAKAHPRLTPAPRAELAIVIPAGYNLGHVHFGKGLLWGLPELHRERKNPAGVTYGEVMSGLFHQIEQAMDRGMSFDILWDLPGVKPTGYGRVIKIPESSPMARSNYDGAPSLSVSLFAGPDGWYTAHAETDADVYYTTGADSGGVYRNARFYWELYGPEDEDMRIIPPGETVRFQLAKPGPHRLRVATVDRSGRSTVVWKEIR